MLALHGCAAGAMRSNERGMPQPSYNGEVPEENREQSAPGNSDAAPLTSPFSLPILQ